MHVVDPARYQRAEIDKFLATLPDGAPLHAIARGGAVQAGLAAYEAADASAVAAQARYWFWGRLGLRASTVGVLVGALMLFPIDAQVVGLPRTIISTLQTLTLVATVGATLLMIWLKPLVAWRSLRAEAERLRVEVFATMLRTPAPAGTDAMAAPAQKLGLLMAAHLDDQLRFFDKRLRQHGKAAGNFTPLRLLGYLLIACAGVLGAVSVAYGLGLPLPDPARRIADWLALTDPNRWQLGVTTIASGVLGHATARSLMDEDERKASMYAVTAANLRRLLARDLAKVEAVSARGEETALLQLFADARAILEREHAVWSLGLALVEHEPPASQRSSE